MMWSACGMREEHGVKPADIFPQDLQAEFRRGVNHQFDLRVAT